MIVISWAMFLKAMIRIRRRLRQLPGCLTNEGVTVLHFVILSTQGVLTSLYMTLYLVVYIKIGDYKDSDSDMTSLRLQITTKITLIALTLSDFVMGFFICYLILVFSRRNCSQRIFGNNSNFGTNSESSTIELVPNLVYLQNQRYLQKFIHSRLEDKQKKKEIAALQYQANLFLNQIWEQCV